MQTVQRLHCVARVNQHLDRPELRTVVDGAGGRGKSVTTEIAPQASHDVWIQFRSSDGVFTDFMRTTGIVTDRQEPATLERSSPLRNWSHFPEPRSPSGGC